MSFCNSIPPLQVNISLNAAAGRLKQTREERDQFDEANNQIIFSLKKKVLVFTFCGWLSYLNNILRTVHCCLSPMIPFQLVACWFFSIIFVSQDGGCCIFFPNQFRRMTSRNPSPYVMWNPMLSRSGSVSSRTRGSSSPHTMNRRTRKHGMAVFPVWLCGYYLICYLSLVEQFHYANYSGWTYVLTLFYICNMLAFSVMSWRNVWVIF